LRQREALGLLWRDVNLDAHTLAVRQALRIGGKQVIERMYPALPKLELFACGRREGWSAWGNQAAAQWLT